eukprot:m.129698 g.129698  ORF g.129698 m.129698 type:complete len:385 (+) comp52318_c0_seq8:94-1248(+)
MSTATTSTSSKRAASTATATRPTADLPVALITGANSGVGNALCGRLLQSHAQQITLCLACRSMDKAALARRELLAQYPGASIEILIVDVSNVQSVLTAAAEFKQRFNRLDLMYLNAGIMNTNGVNLKALFTPKTIEQLKRMFTSGAGLLYQTDYKTSEKLQGTFATNVFGHFVLIEELQDLMIQTNDSSSRKEFSGRIIFTSSGAASKEALSLTDVQHEHGVDPYGSSKRALDLLTRELNDRLNSKGLVVYTMCPGLFFSQITYALVPSWVWWLMLPILCLVLSAYFRFFATQPFDCSFMLLSQLRVIVVSLTLLPENAAEALIHLQLPGSRPNPYEKYQSAISLLGRRHVTHKPIQDDLGQAPRLYDTLAALAKSFRSASPVV